MIPKCPECNSKNIRYYQSEVVCQDCGLVLASAPPYHDGVRRLNYPFGFIIK